MLIEHLLDLGEATAAARLNVGDLNAFYQAARARSSTAIPTSPIARASAWCCSKPATRRRSRCGSGSIDVSSSYFSAVYAELGVLLTRRATCAARASTTPMLPDVAAELEQRGLATISDGAICVFPPGFTEPRGRAAAAHRAQAGRRLRLRHRPISPPSATARRARAARGSSTSSARRRRSTSRWSSRSARWRAGCSRRRAREHVAFGIVLGPDKKMFKTRARRHRDACGAARRSDRARADAVTREDARRSMRPTRARAGADVGIGAVKYADLVERSDQGLRLRLGSHARVRGQPGRTFSTRTRASIRSSARRRKRASRRRHGARGPRRAGGARAWARAARLRRRGARVAPTRCSPTGLPVTSTISRRAFTAFYEHCPVLRAPDDKARESRLKLCELDRARARAGLEPARHRGAGADVSARRREALVVVVGHLRLVYLFGGVRPEPRTTRSSRS